MVSHKPQLRQFLPLFDEFFTKTNVLCALCGGTDRFRELQQVVPKNSFIVTANSARSLIADFAELLIGTDQTDSRVFYTYGILGKHEIITKIIFPQLHLKSTEIKTILVSGPNPVNIYASQDNTLSAMQALTLKFRPVKS